MVGQLLRLWQSSRSQARLLQMALLSPPFSPLCVLLPPLREGKQGRGRLGARQGEARGGSSSLDECGLASGECLLATDNVCQLLTNVD